MKTLYLTDLDGTFLNSEAEISNVSKEIISNLIKEGLLFTVSTARTHATVLEMFENINIDVPLVLMNGVLIFDPVTKTTVAKSEIPSRIAEKVIEIYEKHNKIPMLYYEDNGKLKIFYRDLENKNQQKYINSRTENTIKEFYYTDSPALPFGGDGLVYIVTLDPYDELKDIYEEVSKIDELNCMFYRDNYTDCYFLEIMSSDVSKGISALKVKELINADEIVAFGDNLNDISIFEVADRSYAVSNAHNELKSIATAVIDSNNDDAVAKFIESDFNTKDR